MKRKTTAIALAFALALVGTTAYASYDIASKLRWSNDIVRFKGGCSDNDFDTSGEHCGRVTTFEHDGNRCYVAYNENRPDANPSISCLRENDNGK